MRPACSINTCPAAAAAAAPAPPSVSRAPSQRATLDVPHICRALISTRGLKIRMCVSVFVCVCALVGNSGSS